MGRARYLLGNINLINIMLTVVLIFLVNYMLLSFLNKKTQYSLPVIKKHEEIDAGRDNKPAQSKTPSPLDYVVITEQNLFHPERKIPVEVKEAQPLPKPDFVLYGTLISGDINIAYMEDKKSPVNSPGREKRQTPLKVGESMSGFILKEADENKVILARGEERLTVYLNDPAHPKTRSVQAPSAPVAETKPAVTKEKTEPLQPQPPGGIPETHASETRKAEPPADVRQTPEKTKSGWGGFFQRLRDRKH